MFLKIPISVFDSDGKCTLFIEERCKFSLVCQSSYLVTFLDFDYIVTRQGLDYTKKFIKNDENTQDYILQLWKVYKFTSWKSSWSTESATTV